MVRNWREQYAQGQLADPEQVGQDREQRIQELERMVGYALSRRRDASLTLAALQAAPAA